MISDAERLEQIRTARMQMAHQVRDAEELVTNLRTQLTMLDGAISEYEYRLSHAANGAVPASAATPHSLVPLPNRAERRRRRRQSVKASQVLTDEGA
jgi:hypothetical protein